MNYRRLLPLLFLATLSASPLSALCRFEPMPSPHNPAHQGVKLSDPTGTQVAYFDLYWGGTLASLKHSGTERLYGLEANSMVQPTLMYWPNGLGQPPYQPIQSGDAAGQGRPPRLAYCRDNNSAFISTGLSDLHAGNSGMTGLLGSVRDGVTVSGMYAAPYTLTTVASFVPNLSGASPAYYLRLQQIVTNNSDVESLPFNLYLRGSTNSSYTTTPRYPTTCTGFGICPSDSTPLVAGGRYPTSGLTNGVAFSVSPSSFWNGMGASTWTEFVNPGTQRWVSLANVYWTLAPGASRRWEWYVMSGDWTPALAFAQRPRLWSVEPSFGPRTGGTPVTLIGSQFTSSSTVSIGGVPASNVVYVSPSKLTATVPAGSSGGADVVVTNPGALSATLTRGFVRNFDDVTDHESVARIARAGVTSGCGGNAYCAASNISRAQMAVFLLVAKYGLGYTPPPATGTVFGDVPANHPFAAWIEKLVADGISSGCQVSPALFCPDALVPREQMAVFLLRARLDSTFVAQPAVGDLYSDVPLGHPFDDWIEEISHAGAMGTSATPCTARPCPFSPSTLVNREKMALYLATLFELK